MEILEQTQEDLRMNAHLQPISFDDLMYANLEDKSDCLIGDRFICREGSALIVAQSGAGKSTLALQMSLAFASGKSIWGLDPHCPRKILLIQAENSFLDLAEPIQSIARIADYTAEELSLINENFKAFSQDAYAGDSFVKYFDKLCEKFKPDLVVIDPFLSYLGGDVSKQEICSKFLRNQLNPIIHKHELAVILIHHTGKPKEFRNGGYSEFAYLGIGSSDVTNWARSVSVLVRNRYDDNVFEFVHVKRASRAGTKAITYLKQGKGVDDIYWYETEEPKKPEKSPKAKKSKYDFMKLEYLKPMNKKDLITYIKEKLTSENLPNDYSDIKKVINSAKREIITFNESTQQWQGTLHVDDWITHEFAPPLPSDDTADDAI